MGVRNPQSAARRRTRQHPASMQYLCVCSMHMTSLPVERDFFRHNLAPCIRRQYQFKKKTRPWLPSLLTSPSLHEVGTGLVILVQDVEEDTAVKKCLTGVWESIGLAHACHGPVSMVDGWCHA